MRTVQEVGKISGVSVRTLHHYDAIGLLKPTQVSKAGYRLYDDTALRRLQTILLFRELRFPLKEIKAILDSPGFDQTTALRQQIELLELQQKRLSELLSFARQITQTGGIPMDFSAFDKTEIDAYAAKAKALWGKTDAYKEYEQKAKGQSAEDANANDNALMDIFASMGAVKDLAPDSAEAQALVGALRQFISEKYYTCTPEILHSLGQMYIAGDSMTENIDRAGGAGTAAFAAKAIEIYCRRV